MSIAIDPGRPGKATLIPRFVAMKLRDRTRKLKIALGIKHQFDVLPHDWSSPDSELANRASFLASQLCSPVILAHAHRTYCFGAILATRDGVKFDRELAYVASVLHDIGLHERLESDPGSFEWVGAREARAFCEEYGLAKPKCDLVHDVVALHSSVGIANRREPEVALVHYGASLDLMGLRVDEIPKVDLDIILERHSREKFKCEFGTCLTRQAQLKPNTHMVIPPKINRI